MFLASLGSFRIVKTVTEVLKMLPEAADFFVTLNSWKVAKVGNFVAVRTRDRMGKSGPLEHARLVNQIQGFRIPDRWEDEAKKNMRYKRGKTSHLQE